METTTFAGTRVELAGQRPGEFTVEVRPAVQVEGPRGEADVVTDLDVRLVGRDASDIPAGCQVKVSGRFSFSGSGRRTSATTRLELSWQASKRRTATCSCLGRVSYEPATEDRAGRPVRVRKKADPAVEALPDELKRARRERIARRMPCASLPESTVGRSAAEKVRLAVKMMRSRSTRGGKDPVPVLAGDDFFADQAKAAAFIGCDATSVKRAADRKGSVRGVSVARVGEAAGRTDLSLRAAALLALVEAELAAQDRHSRGGERAVNGGEDGEKRDVQLHAAGLGLFGPFGSRRFLRACREDGGLREIDGALGGLPAVRAGRGSCMGRMPD